jgi:hypothetical protein
MFDEGELGWPKTRPFRGPVFVVTHIRSRASKGRLHDLIVAVGLAAVQPHTLTEGVACYPAYARFSSSMSICTKPLLGSVTEAATQPGPRFDLLQGIRERIFRNLGVVGCLRAEPVAV